MTAHHRSAPASDSAAIEVNGLTKRFGARTVWQNVSLTCPAGSVTALTGPSGSGKSTLLNCLGALDTADAGTIAVDSCDLQDLSARKRRSFRRHSLGFLFQDYALVPDKSVEYNLRLAASSRVRAGLLDAALNQVGLDGYRKRKVYELSGGEQQRVAVARILVRSPRIILADEPTGALDQANGVNVIDHLRALAGQGAAVVIATHSTWVRGQADQHIDISAFAPSKGDRPA